MPKYSDEMEAKILALIEKGKRNSEISRELNADRGAIARRRKAHEKRKQYEENIERGQEETIEPASVTEDPIPSKPEYATEKDLNSLRAHAPQQIYKGYRVSFDPALMGRYRSVGRNPLDAALESEDAALAQELKATRVEGILLKHKASIAKFQREIDNLEKESEKKDSDDSSIPRISVAMARQISMLPQEEQNKVMQTYAAFRSIDQSKGRGDSLLPLLIGYSKLNPGTQQSDMATYAKAMSDQFKTGIDAMKAVMPDEEPSDSMELLKLFRDLVQDSIRKSMEELVTYMHPQPSAFEQIFMNPEMRSTAKEMGMFGSSESRSGGTDTDLKIKEMREGMELSMKKMDLEHRKVMLEYKLKNRRSDNITASLATFGTLAAGPVAQRMQQLGKQQGATHMRALSEQITDTNKSLS